jgi:hypothetical protein
MLQPEIPVQGASVVLLDDEGRLAPALSPPAPGPIGSGVLAGSRLAR